MRAAHTTTIFVSDEQTVRALFEQRLLSAAYSKHPLATNSRKRTLISLFAEPSATAAAAAALEEAAEDRKTTFSATVALPLRLLAEEAAVAVSNGIISLQERPGGVYDAQLRDDGDGKRTDFEIMRTPMERACSAVFADLWSKGWIVTRGTNFGCEYLVYSGHPGTTHSRFMICVGDPASHEAMSVVKLSAITALATKVRKRALVATVRENGISVDYTLLEGCLFRRSDFLRGQEGEAEALRAEAALENEDEYGAETSVAV